ncbi:MAG TPA: hypothetical protein VND99_02715 [Candidatus Acidoferrales bacterium]|nr:hypothetical protein [Candidatus Acidoferrales bacterium]
MTTRGRKKRSKLNKKAATYEELKGEIQKLLTSQDLGALPSYSTFQTKQLDINDEIARRENIKNKDLEQDIRLKKMTLIILFIFLGVETTIIFAFSLLQATSLFGFKLEEWSFKLLVTATLIQIAFMLQVAVKYLFRDKKT